jgi:DNA-dependent RNA polymerase auxiliary subunit epsilon
VITNKNYQQNKKGEPQNESQQWLGIRVSSSNKQRHIYQNRSFDQETVSLMSVEKARLTPGFSFNLQAA